MGFNVLMACADQPRGAAALCACCGLEACRPSSWHGRLDAFGPGDDSAALPSVRQHGMICAVTTISLEAKTPGAQTDNPTYWLDLFTPQTWTEFLEAGADVTGFRGTMWSTVQKIRPGDYFLAYLTGASRFVGLLRVTSEPYWDETPRWSEEQFPCRLGVSIEVSLVAEEAVPIHDLLPELSIYNASTPNTWSGRVRGSPARWAQDDGDRIAAALVEAREHPVVKPLRPGALNRRARPGEEIRNRSLQRDRESPVRMRFTRSLTTSAIVAYVLDSLCCGRAMTTYGP